MLCLWTREQSSRGGDTLHERDSAPPSLSVYPVWRCFISMFSHPFSDAISRPVALEDGATFCLGRILFASLLEFLSCEAENF